MKSQLDCIPCFTRQALDTVKEVVDDPARREEILRRLVHEIAEADWQQSPPEMAQQLHRIIRGALGDADPYAEIKSRMNRIAAQLRPVLRGQIRRHPDPFEAAVRISIAGNLLDTGAQSQITAEELPAHVQAISSVPLRGDLEALRQAVDRASSILILADNAGEIFFDGLLIEQLPAEKVTLAVRGAPVLNDATRADAEAAGITEQVAVIDNGSDAPGTLLEDCSEDFRRRFDDADLIIAKGQGNYETLSDMNRNLYFLFTVKCPLVAAKVGEPVGSLVVKRAGKEEP